MLDKEGTARKLSLLETQEQPSSKNGRLTKNCLRVLEVLKPSDRFLSARDIYFKLRSDATSTPGLTTVYRSLEILVEHKLVRAAALRDGEKVYEAISDPNSHYHILICSKCLTTVRLDSCPLDEAHDSMMEKYGFKLQSHAVELMGMCKVCGDKDFSNDN